MLQSNIQVLQDLVGFFYSKTCSAGTALYEHTFYYFDKIMRKKTMNYVHLNQNLHIHKKREKEEMWKRGKEEKRTKGKEEK